jgi:hypothetical protein
MLLLGTARKIGLEPMLAGPRAPAQQAELVLAMTEPVEIAPLPPLPPLLLLLTNSIKFGTHDPRACGETRISRARNSRLTF